MKNIIFLTTLTLWSMGKGSGGPAFTKTIDKYIDDGWNVYLISDEPQNAEYPKLDSEHNIQIKPSMFKSYGQLRKIGLLFRILDHAIANRRFYSCAEELIKTIGKDTCIYAYEIFGVKAAKKLSKKRSLPMISRFQGTILCQYKNTAVNRLRFYPHFQAISKKTDLVIMTDDGTQGDRVLDEVENNSKRLFLKNGLDLMNENIEAKYANFEREKFRESLGIKSTDIMMLTVSRLVPWKRVERAIDGLAASENKNLCLVIVGDGDCKNELRGLAEEKNVLDRVVFTGAVSHDEVYNYMMASDIFVSLYDLSNVGNPLLEAMTLGKCIVTLDVGDTFKLIKNRDNGVLLTYDTLPSLGKVLSELAQNTELRSALCNNAAKFAQENFYSWEKRMDIETEEVMSLRESRK